MEKSVQCYHFILSYYYYKCAASSCDAYSRALHKGHVLATYANYQDIISSRVYELATARNLRALHQCKQEVDEIFDTYISNCENATPNRKTGEEIT